MRRRVGLVICRKFARHRIRRVPYIGVPRAVVEQRIQRQLIGDAGASAIRAVRRHQYRA